jgi:hypothetical protein
MYNASRARESRAIGRFFPSRAYLEFRLYTQYGHEEVSKTRLRKDIADYLEWMSEQK